MNFPPKIKLSKKSNFFRGYLYVEKIFSDLKVKIVFEYLLGTMGARVLAIKYDY